jgi:hypothetical protein
MCCSKIGCCGRIFQLVLGIINIIFFLGGAGVFVLGAICKWSDLLNTVKNELTNAGLDIQVVDYLFIFFMVLGACVMIISVTGIIGACCLNRCFLVIYVIIIGILFLIHFGAFIAFLVLRPELKKAVVDAASTLTNDIVADVATASGNSVSPTVDQISQYCSSYKTVADFFKCCDFNQTTQYQNYVTACCPSDIKGTCPDQIYSFIDSYFIVLPNSLIVSFEFLILVFSIVLIVKIGKDRNSNENMEMGYYSR